MARPAVALGVVALSAGHAACMWAFPARPAPRKAAGTRGAGLLSADRVREWLRSSRRSELESTRIRACSKSSLSAARTACITETPIPLEGGYGGHPNIAPEVFASLAHAKLSAAARIIRVHVQVSAQRADARCKRSAFAEMLFLPRPPVA